MARRIRYPRWRVFKTQEGRSFAEAGFWTTGLLAVALANPEAPALIQACLFKAVGFAFCPGCGLGHAIGYLARGEFILSFESHPLALLVVIVLVVKIITLIHAGMKRGTHSGDTKLYYV